MNQPYPAQNGLPDTNGYEPYGFQYGQQYPPATSTFNNRYPVSLDDVYRDHSRSGICLHSIVFSGAATTRRLAANGFHVETVRRNERHETRVQCDSGE